ncbi:MAG: preprotein translocase subunit SecY [Pirellulales bacterium]|nr:preprotein translocase subunit SecY [Pirellulales bacterium]
MWEKLRVVWQIPELRRKILLTLALLAVYRLGFQIPLPIVDPQKVEAFSKSGGGVADVLQQVAVFSAAQVSNVTIFGLGIMPYISASIIFQLLGSVYPPLERLQKEGEAGRKKINEYTRYATVFICIIQSWIYINAYVVQYDLVDANFLNPDTGNVYFGSKVMAVLTMTAGTIFLMWVGEQIDEFGIGNGISLLIMAGILAGMPGAFVELIGKSKLELSGGGGDLGIEQLLLLVAMFFSVIVGVVFITLGQRRIPMQSAKHIRGRKVVGGGKNFLPLKVNQAGVMPIIFASSLLMLPALLFGMLARINWAEGSFWSRLFTGATEAFQRGNGFVYAVSYIALIYFFCFFWTAITFNPKDVSENLKNYGSFIPGYRPGKRTADYLEKVMVRITYVGAGFLALIAIIPTMISTQLGVSFMVAQFYGGTGLLIAVSVAFDLVQKIDSHLVMRNYTGLLEKS